MAGSTYAYITLGNLEDYTGIDYSTVDSVRLADAKIEAMISIAERMVNGFLGVSTAQTKTDALVTAVTLISARIVLNNMVELGYAKEDSVKSETYIDSVMAKYLTGDSDVMVDSIPMSGASYHKPDSRTFL